MSSFRFRIGLAAVLVVVAVVWVLVNKPVEGPTLIRLTPHHGVTVGDLPSAAAVVVAAVLILTARR